MTRLTIRAALYLGFGLTFGVLVLTGYQFSQRMEDLERRANEINMRYMRSGTPGGGAGPDFARIPVRLSADRNKEIAAMLSVSATTIETHRAHILQKLDMHSTAGLVRYAVRRGVVS